MDSAPWHKILLCGTQAFLYMWKHAIMQVRPCIAIHILEMCKLLSPVLLCVYVHVCISRLTVVCAVYEGLNSSGYSLWIHTGQSTAPYMHVYTECWFTAATVQVVYLHDVCRQHWLTSRSLYRKNALCSLRDTLRYTTTLQHGHSSLCMLHMYIGSVQEPGFQRAVWRRSVIYPTVR